MTISCDIFEHFDERWEFHALLLRYTFRLEYDEIIHGLTESVYFKMLTFPDETLTTFADGLTLWVCLLEHLLVEVVVNPTLSLDFLSF